MVDGRTDALSPACLVSSFDLDSKTDGIISDHCSRTYPSSRSFNTTLSREQPGTWYASTSSAYIRSLEHSLRSLQTSTASDRQNRLERRRT